MMAGNFAEGRTHVVANMSLPQLTLTLTVLTLTPMFTTSAQIKHHPQHHNRKYTANCVSRLRSSVISCNNLMLNSLANVRV